MANTYRYAGSKLEAKGRANKNLVRKFQNVLRQSRARGQEEDLIVTVGFLLSDVATDTKEQVVAAAKLYSELREGPLKPWKAKADYCERAESFLRSEEGVDWTSGWFQPHSPTRDDDAFGTLERSIIQEQDGVRQRTGAKVKMAIMASDARSTPKLPVVQGQDGVEQLTKAIGHVSTRNDTETNKNWADVSPSADDVIEALFRPSARLSEEMGRESMKDSEEKAITSSRGRSVPTARQSGGMADMANPMAFTLPEPLHPQYRRSVSEGQILFCLRCGQRHPGPWSIIYPPPNSIPIPCEPATGVRQPEITLGGRGWTKELVIMAAFLVLMGLSLLRPVN